MKTGFATLYFHRGYNWFVVEIFCVFHSCRRRPRRAFTLIELLVVISIISLLISMLMPSLSRARQQAKATVCLARLAEIMKVTTAYSNEYEFALPPLSYPALRPGQSPTTSRPTNVHGWAEALYRTTYGDTDFAFDKDYPVQRNTDNHYQLFMCVDAEPKAGSTGHYRPYELSWGRGSLDRVKAKMPLLMDGNPVVENADDLLRSDFPREHIAGLVGEAYIDERHYGGANFAFNDGHAERSTTLKETLAADWDMNPDTPNQ